MKNRSQYNEVPYEAETFKIVPVVQLDGKATRIPVQLEEGNNPVSDSCGKVLHIVMSKDAFCVWRS